MSWYASFVCVVLVQAAPMKFFKGRSSGTQIQPDSPERDDLYQILYRNRDIIYPLPDRRLSRQEKQAEIAFMQSVQRSKKWFKQIAEARLVALEAGKKLVDDQIAPSLVDLSQHRHRWGRDLAGRNEAYKKAVEDVMRSDLRSAISQLYQEASLHFTSLQNHPDELMQVARVKFYDDCDVAEKWARGENLPHEDIVPARAAFPLETDEELAIAANIQHAQEEARNMCAWYS